MKATKTRLTLRKEALRSLTGEEIRRVGATAMERLLVPAWPWINCTGLTM